MIWLKSKRSKACAISTKARQRVLERDNYHCVICGTTHNLTLAHIIPRNRGGLGNEKNLVALCVRCHNQMDFTTNRQEYLAHCKKYLKKFYGEVDIAEIKYGVVK